jgi:hypothetical protein
MQKESRILIIKGKLITGEYKRHYYSNGLSSALADLFPLAEIEHILNISFDIWFSQPKYLSEELMKDRLFEIVLETTNKIRENEAVAAHLSALSVCYNRFLEFPKIRPAIALTDNLENYPQALVILGDHIFNLETVKDILMANIVEGIRSNCERHFLELKRNHR